MQWNNMTMFVVEQKYYTFGKTYYQISHGPSGFSPIDPLILFWALHWSQFESLRGDFGLPD
jgi:predicted ATPase